MMAAPIAIWAVDALVSNTNNFTVVPVRPDGYRDRLWVLFLSQKSQVESLETFLVRPARAQTIGCKSRTRLDSGKR